VHYSGQLAVILYSVKLDDVAGSFGELDWPLNLLQYLHRSHYGVDLFFLLSGFLVYKIVTSAHVTFGRFFWNRIWRIYPVFVLTEALYIARMYGETGVLWPGGIVGNLLLLNGIPGLYFPAYNFATWSLFFEFVSYAIIPAALWCLPTRWSSATRGRVVALAIVGAAVPLAIVVNDGYIRFIMFAAGIVLATVATADLSRLARVVPDSVIAVLYVACTTFFAASYDLLTFIPLYFLAALLLVNQAVFGCGWLNALFSGNLIRYFGNMSFSFYLIHGLCMHIAFTAVPYDESTPVLQYVLVTFVASVVLSIFVATLLFVTVEKQYFYWKNARARKALQPRLRN